MLGNKRKQISKPKNNKNTKINSKPNNFKPKSFSQKNKGTGGRRSKEDEEILSDSDNNNLNNSDISNDEFFEKEENSENDNNNTQVKESADSKRLRLARTLISNIEGKIISENNLINNTENNNSKETLVNDYLKSSLSHENSEFKYQYASKMKPKHIAFLKGHKASVTQVSISSDSKNLISCSKDTRAIKWDLTTQKKTLLPAFSKRPLLTCMYAPDDKHAFFAGSDKHIYQVDLHNEKLISSFKAHNDVITGLVFDTNSEQYYSIGNDKVLNVWGVSPTQRSILLETFYGHTNKICDFDILTTNKIISCGMDSLLNLWKIDSQSFLRFQATESFSSLIDNIRCLNQTTFVTGAYDGMVTIWKTNKKKAQNKISFAHGFAKEFTPKHSFFYSEENFLDFENNLLDSREKNKFLNIDNLETWVSMTYHGKLLKTLTFLGLSFVKSLPWLVIETHVSKLLISFYR